MTRLVVERIAERLRIHCDLPDPRERRRLREAAGLNVTEFAEAIGVSRPCVSQWEAGARHPRGINLERYVTALNAVREATESGQLPKATQRRVRLYTPGSGYMALTDERLREVALVYLSEASKGAAKAMSRVAERYDKPEQTVRQWVARARRDGWLAPGIRGRPMVEAGPRLVAESAREC